MLFRYYRKTGENEYQVADTPKNGGDATVYPIPYDAKRVAMSLRTAKNLSNYNIRITNDINDKKLLWKSKL